MSRVLERLLNLLAFLRTVDHPVDIDEIRFTVAGYDRDNDTAFRRMFERDKELLRGAGIPLETVVLDDITQALGYELPAERFEMADPDLTDEELAALYVATRMVRMGGAEVGPAFQKLGGAASTEDQTALTANLGGDADAIAELFDAVSARREVTGSYRGKDRRLQPQGLLHRRGHWYLVTDDGDERRVFRVDRGEGWEAVGPGGAFERIDIELRSILPELPWESGDEQVEATVRFDDEIAWWVRRQLPETTFSHGDGYSEATLDVAHRDAFVSWLLELGDTAELVSPPELRAAVVERVRGVA